MQLGSLVLLVTVPPDAGGTGGSRCHWCSERWWETEGPAVWLLGVLLMGEGLRLGPREQNSPDKIPDTYLSLQVQVGPVGLVVPGEVGDRWRERVLLCGLCWCCIWMRIRG